MTDSVVRLVTPAYAPYALEIPEDALRNLFQIMQTCDPTPIEDNNRIAYFMNGNVRVRYSVKQQKAAETAPVIVHDPKIRSGQTAEE